MSKATSSTDSVPEKATRVLAMLTACSSFYLFLTIFWERQCQASSKMERKRRCVKKLAEYYDDNSDDSSEIIDDTDSDPDFVPDDQLATVNVLEDSIDRLDFYENADLTNIIVEDIQENNVVIPAEAALNNDTPLITEAIPEPKILQPQVLDDLLEAEDDDGAQAQPPGDEELLDDLLEAEDDDGAQAQPPGDEEQQEEEASPRVPYPSPLKSPRKRKRNVHITLIERRKKRRNESREYKNKAGNIVSGKKIGEMCRCPLKCYEKLNEEIKLDIFNAFWDMGNFNTQNAYLFGCIEKIPIKRRYCENAEGSYKQNTFVFRIKLNGESQRVCKKSFMSIHGLQNSRGRVNNIIKNVKANLTTPPCDKRGKHQTRPLKTSAEAENGVHEHIKSVPKYKSHYSRQQNPSKVYLGCDLTIRNLYLDYYLSFCQEREIPTVSEDKYRRIFCERYNIGFKFPKSDTCSKCDNLQVIIDDPNKAEDVKCKAKQEKELHLRRADSVREKMKLYTDESKNSPEDLHVITVDLQQTLPTPKLSCGPAFYCRKLWTYNVGIHNCGTGQGYMFMWDESMAKRGSDEIGSCILKYLSVANVRAKKLVVFSDNCGGQIKNWNIMSMWSHLVSTKRFQEIEHYFLIAGHTYLPSDRDFGKIEKYHVKHYQNVYSPEHWREVIIKCGRKEKFKFIVTKMTSQDIINLTKLQEHFNTTRKFCTDGVTPPQFSKALCFRFQAQTPFDMQLKHKMNEEFLTVSLQKRGRASVSLIHVKSNEPNRISKKKLADVNTLLQYIPPIYQNYYNNLVSDENPVEEEDVV